MAWYHFRQNNSGGSFVYDEANGISVHVLIEAEDYKAANDRAEDIGLYFDGRGDCPYCGNRWCEQYDESDGDEEPCVYGTPVGEYFAQYPLVWGDGPNDCYVHPREGKFYAVTGNDAPRRRRHTRR